MPDETDRNVQVEKLRADLCELGASLPRIVDLLNGTLGKLIETRQRRELLVTSSPLVDVLNVAIGRLIETREAIDVFGQRCRTVVDE